MPAPIVVTLGVDDATQKEWDDLRRRWFPPERLVVGAHVALSAPCRVTGSMPCSSTWTR